MKKVGLTGGIASGKSTVSKQLQEAGFPVIDADQVAREIVEPGSHTLEIIFEKFGAHLRQLDGCLDRKALGSIIFSNPEKRTELNQITHPSIARRVQEQMEEYEKAGTALLIYEAPLLFENNIQAQLDEVILVSLSEKEQIKRLQQRDHISHDEAHTRIASQMPLSEKQKLADYIVYNEGSLDDLKKEINVLIKQISKFGV